MLNGFFALSVISLSLAQLVSLSKNLGLNMYAFDFVVLGYGLIGLIFFLIKKQFRIPLNLLGFISVCFFGLLGWVFNFNQFVSVYLGLFYLVRLVGYLLAGCVTYNLLLSSRISVNALLNWFIYSGVFLVFAGFIQLVLLPDFSVLDASLGWDPHYNRLASTFFDPNFLGAYLVFCFGFSVFGLITTKAKTPIYSRYLIISLILLAGIFLTFSRSAWLMLGLFVFTLGLLKYRKMLLVSLLLMFLAYFAVPRVQTRISGITDPSDSAHFRLISWSNTLSIIKENPVLGIGYNNLREAQKNYSFFDAGTFGGNSGAGSDSSFLFVGATTGLFSMDLFIVYWVVLLTNFYLKWLNGKNSWYLISLGLIVGLLLESQFINSMYYPQILFILVHTLIMSSYFSSRT